MRFLFLGVPVSSSNRGVLALGSSLVGLARHYDSNAEIGLLIGHNRAESTPYRLPDSVIMVPIIPCRLSPKSRWHDHLFWIFWIALLYRCTPGDRAKARIASFAPWVAALHRADFVGDIRGGDSFSDIYGMRRFLYGFLLAWVVILVKGQIAQMPQTYGPYKSLLARYLARFLLLRSSVIWARDRDSRRVALDLVGDRKQVLLSPDVAFSLRPIASEHIRFNIQSDVSSSRPAIGINVNGLMYNGGYTGRNMFGLKLNYRQFLPKMLIALLGMSEADIWLIPHTFAKPGSAESDPEACRLVRDSLPGNLQARVRIVVGEYDQHEIKAVISHCDFFVGSRMHACIAALSQGIPCVGVAYSMKFRGVFESVGMQEWIVDGRESSEEHAIVKILELYKTRDQVRSDLIKLGNEAREQLRNLLPKSMGMSREYASATTSGSIGSP